MYSNTCVQAESSGRGTHDYIPSVISHGMSTPPLVPPGLNGNFPVPPLERPPQIGNLGTNHDNIDDQLSGAVYDEIKFNILGDGGGVS